MLSSAQLSGLLVFLTGALVAWAAIKCLRRPFDRFRSLRAYAATLLQNSEPTVKNRDAVMSRRWLAKRAPELKTLAADLRGFTDAHPLLSRTLGLVGYDPRAAGAALMELASLGPGGTSRPELRAKALTALRLRF